MSNEIEMCFFCQKPKKRIIKSKIDFNSPIRMVLSYTPCKKCQEIMNKGVTLISCTTEKPKDYIPPIQKSNKGKIYPVGPWITISEENAKSLFDIGDDSPVIKQKVLLMDKDLFNALTISIKEVNDEIEESIEE